MNFRAVISNFVAAAMTLSVIPQQTFANSRRIERPPQFVLLSFDGSKSIPFWKETRAFAKRNNVKFTYFMSGVYFLSGEEKQLYQAPHHGRGHSDIGFGKDHADIETRVDQIVTAKEEGLELGSHVNGHYDGTNWTYEDWSSEFSQFKDFIDNVFSINRLRNQNEPFWKQNVGGMVRGFRAPLLGVNKDMYKALKDFGYTFDTSGITGSKFWPYEDKNGLWMFPLQAIRLAGTGKRTVTMDYNILVSQCNNQFKKIDDNLVCKDSTPEKIKMAEEETYETYVNLFKEKYFGNRSPIVIGHHFSLWNQGAYWKAMQRFAADVCQQEEVRCVTYSEYIDWAREQKLNRPNIFELYQAGNFDPKGETDLSIASAHDTVLKIEASLELRQQGTVVANIHGVDANLLKHPSTVYNWKVDGETRQTSKGSPGSFVLPRGENFNGKEVSLHISQGSKEIFGAVRTIRNNAANEPSQLENSGWEERVLKGDLPEAHIESIDEYLLEASRIQ